MPDCSKFQKQVNDLQDEIKNHPDCSKITDVTIKKGCISNLKKLQKDLQRAAEALHNCESGLPQPGVQRTWGKINFLRVNDGGGYGGGKTNNLDADVIMRLDTQPGRAFGFKLRDGDNLPVRQAMLGLLRDAFGLDATITIDYNQVENEVNSYILRIEMTDPPS